jgi:hypothetical protein
LKPSYFQQRILLANITGRKGFSREFEELQSLLSADSELVHVHSRPFWELIGHATCEPLVEKTIRWLLASQECET